MQTDQAIKILDYFLFLKKRNQISSSYLFVGKNSPVVKEILKLIACTDKGQKSCGICWDCQRIGEENHPDLFIVSPQPLAIRREDIKEAQRFLSLKSFRLKRKILLIKEGEFSPEAASSLLKTLEEPPPNSFIGVCALKLEGFLPTIISRCKKIFLPFKESAESRPSSDLISDFLKGNPIKFGDRQHFLSFLENLIGLWRDYLLSKIDKSSSLQTKGIGKAELQSSLPERGVRSLPERGLNIEKFYSGREVIEILNCLLKVYAASGNINENLALNLIREKL